MCAAYNCLNKACIHKRNLLRCLCASCRKQIELLNAVVNIIKILLFERILPHNHKPEQNITGDNQHVIFYTCMIFFSSLKALYNQNRINIQLHNFEAQAYRQAGD